MGDRVKIVKILDADREAGNSYCEKPPDEYIGQIGEMTRALIGWRGYWVRMPDGKKFVFAHEELEWIK